MTATSAQNSHLTQTANAYDALADAYADLARGSLDRLILDRAFVAAFAESVRTAGGGTVAELGCGPGHMTAHLRELGLDAFGVDISPALLDIARVDHPGLRFELSSMHALEMPDGELSGILAWYSIIHALPKDLPEYFAEFRRVLASGGHLALGFFESDGGPLEVFDHGIKTPAYRWPIDELAELAASVGFVEIGRMLRQPLEGERFRRGHLLMRLA